MSIEKWADCYNERWGTMLVPEAYSHPAKYAPGLIRRIVEHGLECGYWQAGSDLPHALT